LEIQATDSTKRFSNRVTDYSRYRPSYPDDSIEWIFQQIPLDSSSQIADIGAGTGIFTELIASKGVPVVAVEPNDAMRLESDRRLGELANYRSVAASAEQTTLPDDSVDLITAAQAFHWFDLSKTKAEFDRILHRNGKIVLIWNRRDKKGSEFLSKYEEVLSKNISEYNTVNHANASDAVIEGFLGSKMSKAEFPSHQMFNLNGLKGRLLSSSYCPVEGQPGHIGLMDDITGLYEKYSSQDGVRFDYCTQVYMN